jgi:hypothetical protein
MAQSVSQSVSRFIRDGNYEGKQELIWNPPLRHLTARHTLTLEFDRLSIFKDQNIFITS